MNVRSTYSIKNLKTKIQHKESTYINFQILIYAGKEMKDKIFIESYPIERYSTITLLYRIKEE